MRYLCFLREQRFLLRPTPRKVVGQEVDGQTTMDAIVGGPASSAQHAAKQMTTAPSLHHRATSASPQRNAPILNA